MTRQVLGVALLVVGCAARGPLQVNASHQTECGQGNPELVVVVEDEAGARIPGARISLDRRRGLVGAASTDANGQVSFLAVSSLGPFNLRAELQGFYLTRTSTFNLQPSCRTTIKVPLRVNLENSDCILQVQAVQGK